MTAYLFVTHPEISYPEEVKYEDATWSCSKTTEYGDQILVYLTGNVGICYEWRATSGAVSHPELKFACDVKFVPEFEPPITIQELRAAVSREEWAPPHDNFRSNRSIMIPDEVLEKILALRA